MQKFLRQARTQGIVGIFGAGHLTVAFVNYLEVSEYVDFVLDDNIDKNGMLLPGTAIPIVSPEEFSQRNVELLLLAVNPHVCETIVKRLQGCLQTKFKWYSIFPRSDRFLPLDSG